MQTSGWTRGPHSAGGNDEDGTSLPHLVSRVDDDPRDTYSRPSLYHTHPPHEAYPSSSRATLDMRPDSPRGHRHDDWAPTTHRYDLHPQDDPYRPRHDYATYDTRDAYDDRDLGWMPPPRQPVPDARYLPPGREWTAGYEDDSYNIPTQDDHWSRRAPVADYWTKREDERDARAWGMRSGWSGDSWNPRDDQYDSTVNDWKRKSVTEDRVQRAVDERDRSWQPSASWQSGNRSLGNTNQRNQNNKRNRHLNRNQKGGKARQGNNWGQQQKRDWRGDDGQLNNWTRRGTTNSKPSAKQKKNGRSLSQSPAPSYHSGHSERGRSPTQSRSPRRRRRDSSVSDCKSQSPTGRQSHHGQKTHHSSSPSPHSHHQHLPSSSRNGRRRVQPAGSFRSRSLSRSPSRSRSRSSLSASARSRSQSMSMSPDERPKAVHRLPIATSVECIPVPSAAPKKGKQFSAVDDGWPKRLPTKTNGHGDTHQTATQSMPPPSSPAAPHALLQSTSLSQNSALSRRIEQPTSPIRFFNRGQASSAVKRFFPGDDDDESSHRNAKARAQPQHVVPPSKHTTSAKQPLSWPASDLTSLPDPSPVESTSRGRNTSITAPAELQDLHSSQHTHSRVLPNSPQITSGQPSIPEELKKLSSRPHTPSPNRERYQTNSAQPPSPVREGKGELYEIVSQVGEGTFGKVYKARNTQNGLHVALKRIRMESEKDGFPVTAMREVKLLQSLRNDNVVCLYEMMVSNGSAYMVFEYMDHDLTGILSQTQFHFSDAHLKSFCRQMFAGLAYLHRKGVIHRDIKGSNILVNNRGELKLADFGLARFYQKRRKSDYTNRVITLWYRPPELLLGATVYGPEVDMWSAGCIMLELFTKRPVFQGGDEIHQLEYIFKILGTPTVDAWPGIASLPWYELVRPKEMIPNHFRDVFRKWLSPAGLDLAERLLSYDPEKRLSASDAMKMSYFVEEDPAEARPIGLASLEGEWHELETKRERAKKKRRTEGSSVH